MSHVCEEERRSGQLTLELASGTRGGFAPTTRSTRYLQPFPAWQHLRAGDETDLHRGGWEASRTFSALGDVDL